MREPYIGAMAASVGSLPVVRAMDKVQNGPGLIYLPDPENDPTLVRGRGTDFTNVDLFMVGGIIVLPKVSTETPEQQSIVEIFGPEELRIRSPFKHSTQRDHPLFDIIRTGVAYKVAPHIDQTRMFNAVYEGLEAGGCVGIFPEGGSHDRPNLLPLKAGAAIIALGTLARSPDCGLTIIPCGMNYFNPNKFRSRAVVEFGPPVKVSGDQVEAFKLGGQSKRDAVGSLLETIQDALNSVTQQAPDRETLMLIQATRKLYKPLRMKLPLPVVVELNRRLLKGYTRFKDQPQVVQLTKAVLAYNRQLKALGIKDHQVEWGNARRRPWWLVLLTLLYRILGLIVLSIGTIPSLALFWPVFITTRIISHRKQRKALAGSVVKMDGRDVVSSWKMIVAMGFAPALYTWYTLVVTLWLSYDRNGGYYSAVVPWWLRATSYVPAMISLSTFSVSFFLLMIAVSFAGLAIGEVGVDILRSLPPLFVALNPSSSAALVTLRTQRRAVVARVVEAINTFGPEIFPSFDDEKLIGYSDKSNYGMLDDADGDNSSDDDVAALHVDYATYRSQLKSMPSSEPESPYRSRSPNGRAGPRVAFSSSTEVPSVLWRRDGSLQPFVTGPSNAELGEVSRRIDGSAVREHTRE